MNIFKSAAIVLALAASLAVNAQPTTIKHKGLECTTCHVDGKLTPPDAKTCLAWDPKRASSRLRACPTSSSFKDNDERRSEIAIQPAMNNSLRPCG